MGYNVIEAVNEILKEKGMAKRLLAKKMEITAQAVGDKLKKDDIGVRKLNEMLKFLGYKMVLVPDDTMVKHDWYEIK